ncbi:MAG: DUF1415 domain-containing protein [Bacteroidota bacterium]|nr:DUF1415 domain-containing protein [Bacteroidota bacterium]
MSKTEQIISVTKNWITEVVIGCNFCPFAEKEIRRNKIHYEVINSSEMKVCLDFFLKACIHLDKNENIETSLLIFPKSFQKFDDYLDLVFHAEKLLKKKRYEGIYQVASFHPLYRFAGSEVDDAANFTNRSPWPMLHILREAAVEQALAHYPHPEKIPERNVTFAREKGYTYMKMLRDKSLKT